MHKLKNKSNNFANSMFSLILVIGINTEIRLMNLRFLLMSYFCFGSMLLSFSQKNINERYITNGNAGSSHYYVITEDKMLPLYLDSLHIDWKRYPNRNNLFILSDVNELDFNKIIRQVNPKNIHKATIPNQLEIANDKLNTAFFPIHHLRKFYPNILGKNTSVLIKEFLYDTTDIDLWNKANLLPQHANTTNLHATTMASLIGGNAYSYYTGIGVVPQSKLYSTGLLNILPEDNNLIANNNIQVINHSYGSDINSRYNIEAMLYDQQSYELQQTQHIYSAGNDGEEIAVNGMYQNKKLSNLTGAYKHAKNPLVVGAINSNNKIYPYSSRGPGYDGRIKPEVVNYGEDGTSGAAALTSGMFAWCQDFFLQKNKFIAPSYLIKGILLNTTDDVESEGPDFWSGYGKINLLKAIEVIENNNYFLKKIEAKKMDSIILIVPSNAYHLSISLNWLDPPATIDDAKALVNDLDLKMRINHNSDFVYPWILDHRPDSAMNTAGHGVDTLNTLEKIETKLNPRDTVTVYIISKSNSAQDYAINYSYDYDRHFELIYPNNLNFLWPDSTQNITWQWSAILDDHARIQYRYIHEATWQDIHPNCPLQDKNILWKTPKKNGLLLIKFVLTDTIYYSDTIKITYPLNWKSNLRCHDSMRIQWNTMDDAIEYRLESFSKDTICTLMQSSTPEFTLASNYADSFLRVIALLDDYESPASYFIKPSRLNTNCYINLFDANYIDKSNANLILRLQYISDIDSVIITRKSNKVPSATIKTIARGDLQTEIRMDDLINQSGLYEYIATVYRYGIIQDQAIDKIYLVAPSNPFRLLSNYLTIEDPLVIFSPDADERILKIMDITGKLIQGIRLSGDIEHVDISFLKPGYYGIIVEGQSKQLFHASFIVYK